MPEADKQKIKMFCHKGTKTQMLVENPNNKSQITNQFR